MKSTALHQAHESHGARLVDFAGWAMPVQYSGIREEARHVRRAVGLFDLGHMGRVAVRGSAAEAFLQELQTNDVEKIKPGKIRYAMILDEKGLTQDDILVYREPEGGEGFFLVINASNTERDLGIMRALASRHGDDVVIEDQTDALGMIALQGPRSEAVAQKITDIDLSQVRYYSWARGEIGGVPAALSRTGYTGEDGFEFYLPQSSTVDVWNRLLEVGKDEEIQPCGLGSRDILRLEAGMPLYGHEIDETTTPLHAGLDFAVKYTHDFQGRAALEALRDAGGPDRKLVGLVTDSRRVPRQGYTIHAGETEVGVVCSGGASPTLEKNIATAYVQPEHAEPGSSLEFATRSGREAATVVALPFYKRS